MRRFIVSVVMLLGLAANAGDFVTGNPSLPPSKVDKIPPPADTTRYIVAADVNNLWSAAFDLRTAINSISTLIYGTIPQVNGGTGTGSVLCSAGQVLTSNGTVYSCKYAVLSGIRDFGASCDGSTNDTPALIAAASATGQVVIDCLLHLSTAAGTIKTPLVIYKGGGFDTRSGGSVTLSGSFSTLGEAQIFYGSGFTYSWKVSTVIPEWWGAFGDGNSHPLSGVYANQTAVAIQYPRATISTSMSEEIDGLAIQSAIDAAPFGSTVLLPANSKYQVTAYDPFAVSPTSAIRLWKGVTIRGIGRDHLDPISNHLYQIETPSSAGVVLIINQTQTPPGWVTKTWDELGPRIIGVNFRGTGHDPTSQAWVGAGTTYYIGQYVTNGGNTYRCTTQGTSTIGPTGVTTAVNSIQPDGAGGGVAFWQFIATSRPRLVAIAAYLFNAGVIEKSTFTEFGTGILLAGAWIGQIEDNWFGSVGYGVRNDVDFTATVLGIGGLPGLVTVSDGTQIYQANAMRIHKNHFSAGTGGIRWRGPGQDITISENTLEVLNVWGVELATYSRPPDNVTPAVAGTLDALTTLTNVVVEKNYFENIGSKCEYRQYDNACIGGAVHLGYIIGGQNITNPNTSATSNTAPKYASVKNNFFQFNGGMGPTGVGPAVWIDALNSSVVEENSLNNYTSGNDIGCFANYGANVINSSRIIAEKGTDFACRTETASIAQMFQTTTRPRFIDRDYNTIHFSLTQQSRATIAAQRTGAGLTPFALGAFSQLPYYLWNFREFIDRNRPITLLFDSGAWGAMDFTTLANAGGASNGQFSNSTFVVGVDLPAWTGNTFYYQGTQVVNAGNIYKNEVNCTSKVAGTAPTGTGTGISDGTSGCLWDYIVAEVNSVSFTSFVGKNIHVRIDGKNPASSTNAFQFLYPHTSVTPILADGGRLTLSNLVCGISDATPGVAGSAAINVQGGAEVYLTAVTSIANPNWTQYGIHVFDGIANLFSPPPISAVGPWLIDSTKSGRVYRSYADSFQSAVPTTGQWNVGEVVHNSTPSSGAPSGWVNTVAGTPGTWVVLANVGAATVQAPDFTTAGRTALAYVAGTSDTTLSTLGMGVITTPTSANIAYTSDASSDATRQMIKGAVVAVGTAAAWGNVTTTRRQYLPKFTAKVYVPSLGTSNGQDREVFAGLKSTAPSTTGTGADCAAQSNTNTGAWICYANATLAAYASGVNWMYVRDDGTTAVNTDSGIAVTVGLHTLVVDYTITGQVTMSVDGAGAATFTTNLGTASTAFGPVISCGTWATLTGYSCSTPGFQVVQSF